MKPLVAISWALEQHTLAYSEADTERVMRVLRIAAFSTILAGQFFGPQSEMAQDYSQAFVAQGVPEPEADVLGCLGAAAIGAVIVSLGRRDVPTTPREYSQLLTKVLVENKGGFRRLFG